MRVASHGREVGTTGRFAEFSVDLFQIRVNLTNLIRLLLHGRHRVCAQLRAEKNGISGLRVCCRSNAPVHRMCRQFHFCFFLSEEF